MDLGESQWFEVVDVFDGQVGPGAPFVRGSVTGYEADDILVTLGDLTIGLLPRYEASPRVDCALQTVAPIGTRVVTQPRAVRDDGRIQLHLWRTHWDAQYDREIRSLFDQRATVRGVGLFEEAGRLVVDFYSSGSPIGQIERRHLEWGLAPRIINYVGATLDCKIVEIVDQPHGLRPILRMSLLPFDPVPTHWFPLTDFSASPVGRYLKCLSGQFESASDPRGVYDGFVGADLHGYRKSTAASTVDSLLLEAADFGLRRFHMVHGTSGTDLYEAVVTAGQRLPRIVDHYSVVDGAVTAVHLRANSTLRNVTGAELPLREHTYERATDSASALATMEAAWKSVAALHQELAELGLLAGTEIGEGSTDFDQRGDNRTG